MCVQYIYVCVCLFIYKNYIYIYALFGELRLKAKIKMINITKQSLGVAPVDASEKWGRLNRNKLGVDQPRTGVNQQICKGIRPTNIAIQVFANISGNLISVQLSRRPWCTSVMFSIAFLGPKTTKVLIILDRFKVFVFTRNPAKLEKPMAFPIQIPPKSLQKATSSIFIPRNFRGSPRSSTKVYQGPPPPPSFLSSPAAGWLRPAAPARAASLASLRPRPLRPRPRHRAPPGPPADWPGDVELNGLWEHLGTIYIYI